MNMQSVSDIHPEEAALLSPAEMVEKARELLASGAVLESLPLLLDAFIAQSDDRVTQSLLIEALANTTGYNLPNTVLNQIAESALNFNHDMAALSLILCRQLENDPKVAEVIHFLETQSLEGNTDAMPVEALEQVLGNQLFILVASKGIAASETVEKLIKAIRRNFLLEWCSDNCEHSLLIDSCPEILTAIAGQCFNTEYIYEETAEETILVNRLYSEVQSQPLTAGFIDLAILGTYKPLWAVLAGNAPTELEALIQKAEKWPNWIQVIWKAQFLGPCQEMFLKANLPAYTQISEGASRQLERQYDAFPFPRWQTGTRARRRLALKEYLSNRFPHSAPRFIKDSAATVLFAGCGTGEEIIKYASGLETENILALDLSKTSLAHAQRRAHELGVPDVHFGHGDILELGSLGARFDVIVCESVLDHMLLPAEGLRALKHVAKPETVFSIKLFSERARKAVKAAHDLVTDKNLKPNYEGLRQFRAAVRCLPEGHTAKGLEENRQFYSASELHDLAFNIEEHCFTPAELQLLLLENGLQFIGFDFDDTSKKALYQQCFPEDVAMTNLGNWELLDNECPDLFADGMHFWCYQT